MPTYGRHYGPGTATAYPVMCSVCGVVWPRSRMRYDGSGQLICPDEGNGRDATALDRAQARIRPLKQKGRSDGLQDDVVDNPSRILGDNLYAWTRAELGEFVELNSLVTRITNLGGTGDLFVSASQRGPSWLGNAFSGRPGYRGKNGLWQATMRSGSATPLPAGRPYIWVVAALESIPTATSVLYSLISGVTIVASLTVNTGSGKFRARMPTGPSGAATLVGVDGPTMDTDPHLFEIGFNETAADRFMVDGVGFAGPGTTAAYAETDRIAFGSTPGWPGSFCEMVTSYSLPTSAQKTRMRDYFALGYSDLDIA